jgi:hypothetical protein
MPLDLTPNVNRISIAFGASPRERGRLQRMAEALWSVSAELEAFAIHFDQPHLTLSEPIREKAHRHFMGQGFLALIDEKAT